MATPLPPAADFTGSTVTEAQFKTKLTELRTFLADLLGTDGVESTALAALMVPFNGANAKNGAYTVEAADRGKVIYYTGTGGVNLTIPTTATTDIGVGFTVSVKNRSSGIITILRSGSDTIDGATSVTLAAGESVILFAAAAAAWVRIAYNATSDGQFKTMQAYGPGSYTWTKPAGLKRVKVIVIGGGGGSAGVSVNGISGGGGGGGGTEKVIEAASLGGTESVVVGYGGNGGNATPTNGSAGGNSSFGAHCTAYGGGGGAYTYGGAGGSCTGGSFCIVGSPGGNPHINANTTEMISGPGGGSPYGGGARGRSLMYDGQGAGFAGTGHGSGASGSVSSNTFFAGAGGGGGLVIVEEYF